MRKTLLASLMLLAGCPMSPDAAAPTPAPAPPAPPKVPPGCEANLEGTYRHQDDPSFRFEVHDDGATVKLRAFRQFGQTREAINSPAADITLARTADGMRGAAHATQDVLPGVLSCPITFPYLVTACNPGSITLRGLPQVDVHVDRVTTPDGGALFACGSTPNDGAFTENVLVKDVAAAAPIAVDAGAPIAVDAGTPGSIVDAGSMPSSMPAGPLDAGAADSADAGEDHGVLLNSETLRKLRNEAEENRPKPQAAPEPLDAGAPDSGIVHV